MFQNWPSALLWIATNAPAVDTAPPYRALWNVLNTTALQLLAGCISPFEQPVVPLGQEHATVLLGEHTVVQRVVRMASQSVQP